MKKPAVNLIGVSGNVFNILALCTRALKDLNRDREYCEECDKRFQCWTEKHRRCPLAEELTDRLIYNHEAHTYDQALALMQEYVTFIGDKDDCE